MMLYAFVLVGATHFGKPMPPGAGRTFLLLTPVVPIGLAAWVIARMEPGRARRQARSVYDPSLPLAFAIAKLFGKPIEKIFSVSAKD
jgi:DNA-binding XRE family transcriptional regulator